MFILITLLVTAPAGPAGGSAPAGKDVPADDEELEEFVPSEKISADSAISFPVDI